MDLIAKIQALFAQIDTNGNKSLSLTELKAANCSIFDGYMQNTEGMSFDTFSSTINSDAKIQAQLFGASAEAPTPELTKSKSGIEQPQIETPQKSSNEVFTKNELAPADDFVRMWGTPKKSVEEINFEQFGTQKVYDCRSADLSQLDLRERKDILLNMTFDSDTKFPPADKMPKDVDMKKIMEDNKNLGLGIDNLHKQGITGKGIKMAIIDTPLGEHQEYSDKIKHYEEIGYNSKQPANMHGSAVTSIAAGDNVGVAPDAEIVYFAAENIKETEPNGFNSNFTTALKKVLEMNEKLPDNEKISVVSISWAFNNKAGDYEELKKTLDECDKKGVFVVSGALSQTNGTDFSTTDRNPQGNADDRTSYTAGKMWAHYVDELPQMYTQGYKDKLLLVPAGDVTIASPTGENKYAHYAKEGMSWATPYLAGCYALAKQANPQIKPEEFLKKALETSSPLNTSNGKYAGRLINPEKLIEELSRK